MILAMILAVYAEGAGVVGTAIQTLKVYKTKDFHGISLWAFTLYAAGNLAWLIYGLREDILPLVVSNSLIFLLSLAVIYKATNRSNFIHLLIYCLVFGGLLAWTFIYFPGYSGWLGALYGLIASTPQIIKVIVEKRLEGMSFLSTAAWITAELSTIAYAYILGAWPLLFGGIRAIFVSSLTLYFLIKKRKKGRILW